MTVQKTTTTQFGVRVARKRGMTAEDLARAMGVSVQQIEASLQRLIAKELVEETKESRDD